MTALFLIAASAARSDDRVRPSALAGSWYPADPEELGRYVDGLLDDARPAEPKPQGTLRALILPHAGYLFSGPTAAIGVDLVRGRDFGRVIVLAPAHRGGFRGLSIVEVDAYETPLGRVPLDADAVGTLRQSPLVSAHPEADTPEHAIEIELPLLQRALKPGWRLVPILVGDLGAEDYRAAADLIRPLADGDTLVVVSSDFTHYGPRFGYTPFVTSPELPAEIRKLDEGALERITARDAAGFLAYQGDTGITVCGFRPIALFLHMLPNTARLEKVAYRTSGDITGDWRNSVSYAVVAVTNAEPLSSAAASPPASGNEAEAKRSALTEVDLARLHRLAVAGVEWAVLGAAKKENGNLDGLIEGLSPSAKQPRGAFVTLWKHGELRGCVGYILPQSPVYQAVLENGVNAARNDRRFFPVAPEELSDLEIEVSVLTPPEPIPSYEDFQVGKQGVILEMDGRQAVYLPEVAAREGWDRETTLTHLARKAGLPPDAWKNGARLEVFSSEKFAAPYPNAAPLRGSGQGKQND